jgi:hypothetical protein
VIDINQEKREDKELYFICGVLFFLMIGLINNYSLFEDSGMDAITGKATTADATTSAIIANYFSVNASTNLTTDGIIFFINSLPAANKSAHGNANGDAVINGTNTFLTVEHDSNVNVRFCIKTNDSLRSGATYLIDPINYWWSNSTYTNVSMPHLDKKANNTQAYNFSGFNGSNWGPANDVVVDGSQYFRFWLSVPANQNPGTYKNQVNFKGLQTGSACN